MTLGDFFILLIATQATIDGDASVVPMLPLDTREYTDFALDGVPHKIRIGAPTRELWVDGQWYELHNDDN